MKLAMLGGTFDPMHFGHIMLGRRFAESENLDKVLIIPTRTPPHKQASVTPGEHRLEMCRLAAEYAGEKFEASDIELKRDGLSYSYYTVLSLLEQYPGCQLHLLIGADMFMTLETWYEFEKLNKLVSFCTVPRSDVTYDQLREHALELNRTTRAGRYIISSDPLMQVSSTQLRAALAADEPVDEFLPPAVAGYIKENGLYSAK